MDEREQLEAKGYQVNTKDMAISWMCVIEWHNRVESFFGATESEAIRQAAWYVARLEEAYRLQQDRQRCEGCGDEACYW